MSYYSFRYMTTLGKVLAAMTVLNFFLSLFSFPLKEALLVSSMSVFASFPLFFRGHEEDLEEMQDEDDMAEYFKMIIFPSFAFSIISGAAAICFFNAAAVFPARIVQEGQVILSLSLSMALALNLWFLVIYFLNVYLKYRGLDSMLIRFLLCGSVAVLSLFALIAFFTGKFIALAPVFKSLGNNLAVPL